MSVRLRRVRRRTRLELDVLGTSTIDLLACALGASVLLLLSASNARQPQPSGGIELRFSVPVRVDKLAPLCYAHLRIDIKALGHKQESTASFCQPDFLESTVRSWPAAAGLSFGIRPGEDSASVVLSVYLLDASTNISDVRVLLHHSNAVCPGSAIDTKSLTETVQAAVLRDNVRIATLIYGDCIDGFAWQGVAAAVRGRPPTVGLSAYSEP